MITTPSALIRDSIAGFRSPRITSPSTRPGLGPVNAHTTGAGNEAAIITRSHRLLGDTPSRKQVPHTSHLPILDDNSSYPYAINDRVRSREREEWDPIAAKALEDRRYDYLPGQVKDRVHIAFLEEKVADV
jgi:hypothetical protein